MPAPVGSIIGFTDEKLTGIPMPQSHFLIEAFDLERWCPVLQAMFPVDDPEALRAILAGMADDDPELEKTYFLDDEELAAIVATFNVSFDAAQLDSKDLEISLSRWRSSDRTPYLIHTRYELPLLLEGRKKTGAHVGSVSADGIRGRGPV